MIAPSIGEQRNSYKGDPPRPWIRLQITPRDGHTPDIELVADTGSPLALIVSRECLQQCRTMETPNAESNFGHLDGGLLHIAIPELGFDAQLAAFGSDALADALSRSHADFAGLIGLPMLRKFDYGGDDHSFWQRTRSN